MPRAGRGLIAVVGILAAGCQEKSKPRMDDPPQSPEGGATRAEPSRSPGQSPVSPRQSAQESDAATLSGRSLLKSVEVRESPPGDTCGSSLVGHLVLARRGALREETRHFCDGRAWTELPSTGAFGALSRSLAIFSRPDGNWTFVELSRRSSFSLHVVCALSESAGMGGATFSRLESVVDWATGASEASCPVGLKLTVDSTSSPIRILLPAEGEAPRMLAVVDLDKPEEWSRGAQNGVDAAGGTLVQVGRCLTSERGLDWCEQFDVPVDNSGLEMSEFGLQCLKIPGAVFQREPCAVPKGTQGCSKVIDALPGNLLRTSWLLAPPGGAVLDCPSDRTLVVEP
jgi:hypothetical protein